MQCLTRPGERLEHLVARRGRRDVEAVEVEVDRVRRVVRRMQAVVQRDRDRIARPDAKRGRRILAVENEVRPVAAVPACDVETEPGNAVLRPNFRNVGQRDVWVVRRAHGLE